MKIIKAGLAGLAGLAWALPLEAVEYARIVGGQVVEIRKMTPTWRPLDVSHKHDWRPVERIYQITGAGERLAEEPPKVRSGRVKILHKAVAISQAEKEAPYRERLNDPLTQALLKRLAFLEGKTAEQLESEIIEELTQ